MLFIIFVKTNSEFFQVSLKVSLRLLITGLIVILTHINPYKVPYQEVHEQGEHRCRICNKSFHHWNSLNAHELIHTGKTTKECILKRHQTVNCHM